MSALFQIGSMITSLIGFIMLVTLIFAEEDSNVFRYFGEKEAMICVAVAFILMVAGYLVDRR